MATLRSVAATTLPFPCALIPALASPTGTLLNMKGDFSWTGGTSWSISDKSKSTTILNVEGTKGPMHIHQEKKFIDSTGQHLFTMSLVAMSIPTTFKLTSPNGREVGEIKWKVDFGKCDAMVSYTSGVSGKQEHMEISASMMGSGIQITKTGVGHVVAISTSKVFQLFRRKTTVAVAQGADVALVVASIIAVDLVLRTAK